MAKKIRSLMKDEEGTGILGAVGGGFLGAMTEAGIFLFDISGIGLCNLPGIYPWTTLHIFPLMGLTAGGSAIGGSVGTLVDSIAALGTAAIASIGTVGCVSSSLLGYLTGMLFSK